jgi:PPOX class probable FMN-dependent enzyme
MLERSSRYALPMNITSVDALRALYTTPGERAVRKQLSSLDRHCRRFIELSPFLVLATAGEAGEMDASPRGGVPGFIKVQDESTLLIPDVPGNNRLDSLENILVTGRVGLLFLIPGVDETLRVNGSAALSRAEGDLALCTDDRRAPKVVVRVSVLEAYLHCAKAFMRSRLWSAESHVDRALLPTLGQMLNDQTGIQVPAESQEAMVKRYGPDL